MPVLVRDRIGTVIFVENRIDGVSAMFFFGVKGSNLRSRPALGRPKKLSPATLFTDAK